MDDTSMPFNPAIAARLIERLGILAAITEVEGETTRPCLTPAMTRANALVSQWFEAADMKVELDAAGNLIGHWAPGSNGKPDTDRPRFVIGSHLDTVVNAGRFDGPMGVLLGLACVEQLREWKAPLPFDIEVMGFSDEEGVRYQTAYLGSSYVAGCFDPEWLKLTDSDGVTLEAAFDHFTGGQKIDTSKPQANNPPAKNRIGYMEAHIEQGPVLEVRDLSVGVVSAIISQTRASMTITGKAGHAGTTPMNLRQDALTAAAELVLFIESIGRDTEGLVATVGGFDVSPNASNVIPAKVRFTLDARHADANLLAKMVARIEAKLNQVCQARGLKPLWELRQTNPAVPCDPGLQATLLEAAAAHQSTAPHMVSGAGHDAVAMSRAMPVCMLFVRCRDGLSHHPDEYASAKDIEVAWRVMTDFLIRLADQTNSPIRSKLTPSPNAHEI